MSNHPPPPNHSRRSLPRPTHSFTSRRALTPLFLLLLVLVRLPAGDAQNGTRPAAPEQPPDSNSYGQKFDPSMAIIMVVLVSAFFLMGFVSVYIRQCAESRFRSGPSDQTEGQFLFGRSPARGVGASVIESFPTFQYKSVKGLKIGKGSLECAVCLNEFEDDDVLRLLPRCNHVFHSKCIDAWLSSHTTCPVCRANLIPKPGEKFEPPVIQVNEPEPSPETNSLPDQVTIRVEDEHENKMKSEPQSSPADEYSLSSKHRPPRSRSTGSRFGRLFPFTRSHSTGHSLVQPGENLDRFTLRLPEDVRDHMIKDSRFNWAKSSAAALPRARSERTGFRRSESTRGRNYLNYERFDQEDRTGRWGFLMTPPFIGRTGSVRSLRGPGGDGVGMSVTPPRSLFRSDKSPPFDRLFIGMDGDDGERSFNRLRPSS